MSEANKFYNREELDPTAGCPEPSVWGQVVGGVIEGDLARRLLEHAAQCAFCGNELLYASHAIEGSQREPRTGLVTGSEVWQKKFAEKIAAGAIDEAVDKPKPEPE